jgi:hypothetical protein
MSHGLERMGNPPVEPMVVVASSSSSSSSSSSTSSSNESSSRLFGWGFEMLRRSRYKIARESPVSTSSILRKVVAAVIRLGGVCDIPELVNSIIDNDRGICDRIHALEPFQTLLSAVKFSIIDGIREGKLKIESERVLLVADNMVVESGESASVLNEKKQLQKVTIELILRLSQTTTSVKSIDEEFFFFPLTLSFLLFFRSIF